MRVFFVTGAPWSGKTTQALRLARHLGLEFCSPADWLRIERDRDSLLGNYVRLNYGAAAIDPLVVDYVFFKVREAAQLHNDIVVDGFPRTPFQAARLAAVCANNPYSVIDLVSLTQNEATRRAMHKTWSPPIGTLPPGEETDELSSSSYHVLTIEDTQRRYEAYMARDAEIMSQLAPSTQRLEFDASIDCELLHRQLLAAVVGSSSTRLVPVQIEPSTQPPQLASAMETAVATQLAMRLVGRPELKRRFVGSHPVSLQRRDLDTLVRHNYMASRKWEGERVLLLFHSGRMWVSTSAIGWITLLSQPARDQVLMRNYTVMRCRWMNAIASMWDDTLLDAEWLHATQTLFVIDCVCVRGDNAVMRAPLLERLDAARNLVPLLREMMPTTRIDFQRYYALADLRFLISTAEAESPSDGIVFTSPTLPYKAARDNALFKWKDASLNTVDLLYVGDAQRTLCVRDTSTAAEATSATATPPLIAVGTLVACADGVDVAVGAVIECLPVDGAATRWRCVKARGDRSDPNADWVGKLRTRVRTYLTT